MENEKRPNFSNNGNESERAFNVVKKRISIVSFISLAISIVAFILYVILLGGTNVYILWIISSIIALFFPLLPKYIRSRNNMRGEWLEIVALVIGSFDFYFVISSATKWYIYIAYVIIIIACILYIFLFNDCEEDDDYNYEPMPDSEESKIGGNNMKKNEQALLTEDYAPSAENTNINSSSECPDSDVKFSLSEENYTDMGKRSNLTYGSDIALEKPEHTLNESTMEEAPHIAEPPASQSTTATESSSPKKRRYCSRCGSLLDKTSTRCPGCNRRLLRINKFKVTIFLFIIAIAGLSTLNIVQYLKIDSLTRTNASLTNNLERIKQYAPNYYMDENGNVIKIH